MSETSRNEDYKRFISEEKEKFRKQLPELLKKFPGKWVIFKDGQVVDTFDTAETAYAYAVETFGLDDPFLLEIVKEEDVQPISFSAELGTNYVT